MAARALNLLDPPRKERSPYATAMQMGIPVLIVLCLTLVWGGLLRWQAAGLKAELVIVEGQRQPLQQQVDAMQSGLGQQQANADLKARIERAQAQLQAREAVHRALQQGELGSSQGHSPALSALARRIGPDVWLTGLTLDAAGVITLRGRSRSPDAVVAVLKQLREEPVLQGRSIQVLRLEPARRSQGSAPVSSTALYEFELGSVLANKEPAPEAASSPFAQLEGVLR